MDFVAALAAVGMVLAYQQDQPVETATAPPLPRHEIVYSGHSDAARRDYDIWRIAADGSQLASLVTLPGHQSSFAISPDGNEIVYAAKGVDGATDLWRRPFGRGEATNITLHPANDHLPCFSPDGKQLAFFSNRDADKQELYILHLETGDLKRMTENAMHDSGACWSPDGGTILFTRYFPGENERSAGEGEIMQLDVESGEETQLTQLGGYNGGLDISPDGSRVAFHRVDDRVELWVMNADGTDAQPITNSTIDEYSPAWSPDGNWLAYTAGMGSDGRGRFDLWLITPTGDHARIISRAANTQMEPSWRPGEFFTH